MLISEQEAQVLCSLINRGSFHGLDLVLALHGPDNVARAEKLLRVASEVEWIEQGLYEPRAEQLFFGIGGIPGDRLLRLAPQHRSPVAHHWITRTTQWLTSGSVQSELADLGIG